MDGGLEERTRHLSWHMLPEIKQCGYDCGESHTRIRQCREHWRVPLLCKRYLYLHRKTTSTAPCLSSRTCGPTHCARYCAPCQPLLQAYSGSSLRHQTRLSVLGDLGCPLGPVGVDYSRNGRTPRPSVERNCRKALLTFGPQQRIARIQPLLSWLLSTGYEHRRADLFYR